MSEREARVASRSEGTTLPPVRDLGYAAIQHGDHQAFRSRKAAEEQAARMQGFREPRVVRLTGAGRIFWAIQVGPDACCIYLREDGYVR